MYKKTFEIRWSDVDANRHLANSAYINFMSHTRMSFLVENDFDMKTLTKYNISPIVFYEHMYYYKEALHGVPVSVTLEVSGLSKDGMFFKFDHNFYTPNGNHLAHCEMQGAWMDLNTRKLTVLPDSLLCKLNTFPKSKHFKVLTKSDTRKHKKPNESN